MRKAAAAHLFLCLLLVVVRLACISSGAFASGKNTLRYDADAAAEARSADRSRVASGKFSFELTIDEEMTAIKALDRDEKRDWY